METTKPQLTQLRQLDLAKILLNPEKGDLNKNGFTMKTVQAWLNDIQYDWEPGMYKELFRNKRFALNEMFQRNSSKFTIFYVKENPCSFFRFSFRATLYLSLST